MRTKTISTFCFGAVIATVLAYGPMVFAAGSDNCMAPVNPTLKGAAMSEKLRRCNSVLKPSKAADPDIIIPAPAIDDPLAIHPKDIPDSQTKKH